MSVFNLKKGISQSEMQEKGHIWQLEVTNNDGVAVNVQSQEDDGNKNPVSYLQCYFLVSTWLKPTTEQHMIVIKKNGQDFQRWDREPDLGENTWFEVDDLYAIKTVGPITQFSTVDKVVC